MSRRGVLGHRATTAQLQAAYPWHADGGLGSAGVVIGRDLSGGAFLYDPWALYDAGILTSPNLLVIGRLGLGKSALVKSYLYRQHVFGRCSWVVDPKGEYSALAEALGVRPIRLVPGGDVRLNPLTARAGWEAQVGLAQAVASAALGRVLRPDEEAGVREALRALNRSGHEPTLPELVKALLWPGEELASRLATTAAALAPAVRDVALALDRLVDGDLRGMFDGVTSAGLDLDGWLVVLDISAVADSGAVGVVMACAAAWLRAMISSAPADERRIVVIDEAWRIMSQIGVGEWLQGQFKLSRSLGVQNIVVMHRLADLSAVGSAGSREVRLAEGLLSDTETKVIYGQAPDQIELTRSLVGLSEVEASVLGELKRGQSLWRVGSRSFVVSHRLSSVELALVDTDARMLGRQDLGVTAPGGADGPRADSLLPR